MNIRLIEKTVDELIDWYKENIAKVDKAMDKMTQSPTWGTAEHEYFEKLYRLYDDMFLEALDTKYRIAIIRLSEITTKPKLGRPKVIFCHKCGAGVLDMNNVCLYCKTPR